LPFIGFSDESHDYRLIVRDDLLIYAGNCENPSMFPGFQVRWENNARRA
jgi:hypothetical protein